MIRHKIETNLITIMLFFSMLFVLSKEANASFIQAQKLFRARDYIASAPGFYAVYNAPRNRAERMRAEWGLAQSLQRLGLYYSASKYYSIIVRRGRVVGNPFFRRALE